MLSTNNLLSASNSAAIALLQSRLKCHDILLRRGGAHYILLVLAMPSIWVDEDDIQALARL